MMFYEVGTFFVWFLFAYVFYKKFQRQRRPRLIIDLKPTGGGGMSLVISNVANEHVYLRNIFFSVKSDEDDELYNIDSLKEKFILKTNTHGESEHGHQCIILSGKHVEMDITGFFYTGNTERRGRRNDIHIGDSVNVFVAFVYGPDDLMLGASRRFEFVEPLTNLTVKPLSKDTRLWTSWWERKKLMRALKKEKQSYRGFY